MTTPTQDWEKRFEEEFAWRPSAMTEETLRKEFNNHFGNTYDYTKDHTDWWLSKFSLYKKELRKKVDGMTFVKPEQAGQFSHHADGYNQAIDEFLALLKE